MTYKQEQHINKFKKEWAEKIEALNSIIQKYDGDAETLSRLIDIKNNLNAMHVLQLEMYEQVCTETR